MWSILVCNRMCVRSYSREGQVQDNLHICSSHNFDSFFDCRSGDVLMLEKNYFRLSLSLTSLYFYKRESILFKLFSIKPGLGHVAVFVGKALFFYCVSLLSAWQISTGKMQKKWWLPDLSASLPQVNDSRSFIRPVNFTNPPKHKWRTY